MPGHGGLGQRRQAVDELTRGVVALGEQAQQVAAVRFGHGLEDVHPTFITRGVYKRKRMCGSLHVCRWCG
ncbi:hypothetical protein GCM10010178_77830 [Lentzea flava]|uniref:Uncharacterized protein n=1 Tax=Lentzea flava TaxID=103732 RepID=A0ABQ2VBJ2_9PSEU|nr:hypothetical protein GCM10010178_77830 [Lentzea flava]